MDIQYTRGDCEMLDTDVILKRFDNPDELRTFDKGTFELLEI